jgi:hypothetical protein
MDRAYTRATTVEKAVNVLEDVEAIHVTLTSLVIMSSFFRMGLKTSEKKLQLSLLLTGVFTRILRLGQLMLGLKLFRHSTCALFLLGLLDPVQGGKEGKQSWAQLLHYRNREN